MLSFKDERWSKLFGGYRMAFDPRPALRNLESNVHVKEAWHELWEDLHHQGDVGEASYAAVPHLVRTYRERGAIDWNTYAIVAVIELAATSGNNPEVPEWLKEDYFKAIRELAEIGATEVVPTRNPFVRVWRRRSSFDTPKAMRTPLADCVQLFNCKNRVSE